MVLMTALNDTINLPGHGDINYILGVMSYIYYLGYIFGLGMIGQTYRLLSEIWITTGLGYQKLSRWSDILFIPWVRRCLF